MWVPALPLIHLAYTCGFLFGSWKSSSLFHDSRVPFLLLPATDWHIRSFLAGLNYLFNGPIRVSTR